MASDVTFEPGGSNSVAGFWTTDAPALAGYMGGHCPSGSGAIHVYPIYIQCSARITELRAPIPADAKTEICRACWEAQP